MSIEGSACIVAAPLLIGCVGPEAPDVLVSEGFPADEVSFPPEWYRAPFGAPANFWVKGPHHEARVRLAAQPDLTFRSASGDIQLSETHGDGGYMIAYRAPMQDPPCTATRTTALAPWNASKESQGVLTRENPRVLIAAAAPCEANFPMLQGPN